MLRVRRVLLGILIIFAIYAIFADPQKSAEIVGNAWDNIKLGIGKIFEFFNALMAQ